MDDFSSWQSWIENHGPRLVLFARQWAPDHTTAEDLVQEAFVKFWSTRRDAKDPLSYLYRTVRTVAIDRARSRQARTAREQTHASRTSECSAFSCALEHEERRIQIEMALAELPREQAEVVTLKIWSMLTFAQIAEVTAVSIGTVSSRYRYALDHLRALLNESEAV